MPEDYREMWGSLGLYLETHDGLAVLSDAYKNIYLSQQNRPAGMGYFDFVISEVHGLRIVELLKDKIAGKHMLGAHTTGRFRFRRAGDAEDGGETPFHKLCVFYAQRGKIW